MPNTVFFTTIIAVMLFGLRSVGLRRLIYKKSIAFYVMSVMMVPLILYVIVGFIGGAKGLVHFFWLVPLGLFSSLTAFSIVGKMLERPLNEMEPVVNSLTNGNVNVICDEKFKKSELLRVFSLIILEKVENNH